MDNKSIFLQQTESLITQLETLFPENIDIRLFKDKYFFLKKLNSNKIIEGFICYVLPHKKQIMSKDDTFFLKGGGQDKLDGKQLNYSLNLKELWNGNLSAINKDIIWKYFQVLIILLEKNIMANIKSEDIVEYSTAS